MHKIFLAVSAMIITSFLMKSYRKLREGPVSKDEVYRLMKAARRNNHREIERRCADARKTFAQMDAISTPRDGDPASLIDSLMQMAPGRFA